MHTSHRTDVPAARLLFDLPAYGRWDHRPLNRQLKQLLAELDDQTLMSLTAHAVQRIASGPAQARRLPI
jgi:cell division FtsZ-interacting protein ZapD